MTSPIEFHRAIAGNLSSPMQQPLTDTWEGDKAAESHDWTNAEIKKKVIIHTSRRRGEGKFLRLVIVSLFFHFKKEP